MAVVVKRAHYWYLALLVFILVSCSGSPEGNREKKQPNFLLIVADDVGWTDIGAFGSEIQTPNIDTLASSGMRFTDYHVSVSCSPSRSMLMTGTDNHIAGLGNMAELLTDAQRGQPGYEGYLSHDVVSLPEVLQDAGYATYMAGKWHLGHEEGTWPADRGFDRTFSMLYGGASHWADMSGLFASQRTVIYTRNGEQIHELPRDFFSSRSYTDYLIRSIDQGREDGKPFLGYLAFTVAHDPLHVPEPWHSLYRGEYDEGYEVLREQRIQGAIDAGVVDPGVAVGGFHPRTDAWDSLSPEEQAYESRAMEVYAGMVENMDYNVGRVIQYLKDIDEYENTVIIFFSDNGSNPWYSDEYPGPGRSEQEAEDQYDYLAEFDNSLGNVGHYWSHLAYGIGWAQASSGPLDYFKLTVGEGGTRSPLIIAGPGVPEGATSDAFAYVTDIMPTMLEMADTVRPDEKDGKAMPPMIGRSMIPLLSGDVDELYAEDEYIGGEMRGGKWMRKGRYKAVAVGMQYGDGVWRLFDVEADPGETNNLAEEMPEMLEELKAAWQDYADYVGVVEE